MSEENAPEPTTRDLIVRFDVLDQRFDMMDQRFDALLEGQENLKERVGSVEQGLVTLTNRVEDMNETLEAVAEAVSKDAVSLIGHERRIRRLEKLAGA